MNVSSNHPETSLFIPTYFVFLTPTLPYSKCLALKPCVLFTCSACPTLCNPMDCCSSVHGDSPGKNTGVGCHSLLQGTVPVQGLNPGLPHCRILYPLSHQGSPFQALFWSYCWHLEVSIFVSLVSDSIFVKQFWLWFPYLFLSRLPGTGPHPILACKS